MKFNFIVFAPNPWEGVWMNRQQLFSRIGKRHDVIYSNGQLRLNALMPPNMQSNLSIVGRIKKIDNVKVETPPACLPSSSKLLFLGSPLQQLYGRQIARHFKNSHPVVLYIFHPKFYELTKHVKHDLCIYHAYDDFSKQKNWNMYKDNERNLLEQADVVIASSRKISSDLPDVSKKPPHVIPNGVDYEQFSETAMKCPQDLASIGTPRIGYVGKLNRKVDFGLLEYISKHFPALALVLIGDIGNLESNQLASVNRLRCRKNVHFLGSKPRNQLPAYMLHMNINMMCYRTDDSIWCSSGYPLKMHEYLAVGNPVISAGIDAVEEFKSVINIARTREEWLDLIRSNLVSGRGLIEERRLIASQNDWNRRVSDILQLCFQAYSQKTCR